MIVRLFWCFPLLEAALNHPQDSIKVMLRRPIDPVQERGYFSDIVYRGNVTIWGPSDQIGLTAVVEFGGRLKIVLIVGGCSGF